MKLSELLKDIEYTGTYVDCDIADVSCDSRKLTPNSVFACIKGVQSDGHDFAQAALAKGVPCILCERDLGLSNQLLVQDTHFAFAKMCANFYGNPAKKLKLVGVTGTNGKTTVTSIIKRVLAGLGCKVGLIGTIQNEIGDLVIPTTKTTPDAGEFQKILSDMVEAGCEYVIIEVSSHALDQCRLADSHFEVAAFTNLTQDHLDYHKDMEDYFQAKAKLFDMCDKGVICIDDSYGRRLALEAHCSLRTFSAEDASASCFARNIEMDITGVRFEMVTGAVTSRMQFGTPGLFSVRNALCAALVCLDLGISLDSVVGGINACGHVKGRSEIIPTGRDFTVLCDYAHTPDGLVNILSSINEYKGKGRAVAVFGCGGDRDRKKRPIMGEVVAHNADLLIVTSDNPRTEDPDAIIDEIVAGIEPTGTPFIRITNRREAIHYAVQHAQPGDIILLAGKGHEDYQVLGTQKVHFDEREVVAEALATLD